jgi:hypothetical protein
MRRGISLQTRTLFTRHPKLYPNHLLHHGILPLPIFTVKLPYGLRITLYACINCSTRFTPTAKYFAAG